MLSSGSGCCVARYNHNARTGVFFKTYFGQECYITSDTWDLMALQAVLLSDITRHFITRLSVIVS